jgi:hypothetical protein
MALLFILAALLGATLAMTSPTVILVATWVAVQLVHVVRERRAQWVKW